MEQKTIKPNFEGLENPTTINNHLSELKKIDDSTPHGKILNQLLEGFEEIDFEGLAFPIVKELREQLENSPKESEKAKDALSKLNKIKIGNKHYLVLSIEHVLQLAKKNRWGLCKNKQFIYIYNGIFWAEADADAFKMFLGKAVEKMGVPIFDARFYTFRNQLLDQFLSDANLPSPEDVEGKVMINLQNGTFEITQKGTKLRPFESSDFITYQLPFEYNPEAKAPLFEAYLNKVLPDIERQTVLAEYLGYIFIKNGGKNLKLEKALVLFGTGANGKSVFFEVVTAMLGRQNVSNYSLQSLTEEKGYYRAMIANKLVNYATEINGKMEPSKAKALISGEPTEACLKYGNPFTMEQYAKFIFNCNELPKEVEYTHGFFRRFLIIPFDVTIPEAEQDKTLHTKIIENELSGVFNWVLNGLNRLLKQEGFSKCEAAEKALTKYKTESDSVQVFLLENNYKASVNAEIALKGIYSEYRNFCFESGLKPCSSKTLADRLRNSGYTTERKNIGTVVNAERFDIF